MGQIERKEEKIYSVGLGTVFGTFYWFHSKVSKDLLKILTY